MQNSSYFIEERALFGCYPKQRDVNELVEKGVRYFVNLTSPNESKIKPYELPPSCVRINFPIRDHGVPRDWHAFSKFISKISSIIATLQFPRKMYIHCRGGHGRAGLIVSILLCHIFKIEPIESLRKTSVFHALRPSIKEKWKAIGSPHEYRQRAFVYRYFEPLNLYRMQYKQESDSGFSRFSDHPFEVDGKQYLCLESALLDKLNDTLSNPNETIDFSTLCGKDAFAVRKYFARKNVSEWKKVREETLKTLILLKFKKYPRIKQKLLRTGLRQINMFARGNFTWPTGDGNNVTGDMLMDIRSSLYEDVAKSK